MRDAELGAVVLASRPRPSSLVLDGSWAGEQVRKEHGASHEPHPCPPLGALEERVPEGRAFAEATAPQAVWKPPLPRSLW